MWAWESSTYDKLSHGKPRVELIFSVAWSACTIKFACWEKTQKQLHTHADTCSRQRRPAAFRALCFQITDLVRIMNSNHTHRDSHRHTSLPKHTALLHITASEELRDHPHLICFDSRYSQFPSRSQKHTALPRTLKVSVIFFVPFYSTQTAVNAGQVKHFT